MLILFWKRRSRESRIQYAKTGLYIKAYLMNLEQLKDTIKSVCQSHKRIVGFDYGEDYLVSVKNNNYPMSFLEIPYSVVYDSADKRFKSFQFALLILMQPNNDNVIEDHENISDAETIGDAIMSKLKDILKSQGTIVDSVNGFSLREFSDDNVSGMRYDVQVRTFREFCDKNYQHHFA